MLYGAIFERQSHLARNPENQQYTPKISGGGGGSECETCIVNYASPTLTFFLGKAVLENQTRSEHMEIWQAGRSTAQVDALAPAIISQVYGPKRRMFVVQ